MKTIVIVGAGGHGRVCADIAEQTDRFERVVFCDNQYRRNTMVSSWPVLFHDVDLVRIDNTKHGFLIGVGQIGTGAMRRKLYETLRATGLGPAIIVSPTACISASAKLGEGSFLGHMAIVNNGAVIGENVIINSRALIEHDACVNNHSHISTGAIVNGACEVGSRSFVGSGAVLVHGVRICADVVIGAGAVVNHNIDQPGTYVGVPARKINES